VVRGTLLGAKLKKLGLGSIEIRLSSSFYCFSSSCSSFLDFFMAPTNLWHDGKTWEESVCGEVVPSTVDNVFMQVVNQANVIVGSSMHCC
jgi:hypothetical protein